MQFSHYLHHTKGTDPGLFNCISCQGKNQQICLHPQYGKAEAEITSFLIGPGNIRLKRMIRNFDDIANYHNELIESGSAATELEATLIGHGHNICPVPFIDQFTIEAIKIANACGENMTPADYFGQTAILIQAINIVSDERARLTKKEMDKLDVR